MATVKEVDERLDALEKAVHSEIADLKTAVSEQAHQFDLKVQDVKAAIATQTGTLQEAIARQGASLQNQLDVFKAEVTVSLNFAKWIGGFAAAIIVALIAFGWSFSSANGELKQKVAGLEQKVEQQNKQLDDLRQLLVERLPKQAKG